MHNHLSEREREREREREKERERERAKFNKDFTLPFLDWSD